MARVQFTSATEESALPSMNAAANELIGTAARALRAAVSCAEHMDKAVKVRD